MDDEPPPQCDNCEQFAEYWCETCSLLLCYDHAKESSTNEHQNHELAPLQNDDDDDEESADNNNNNSEEEEKLKEVDIKQLREMTGASEIDLLSDSSCDAAAASSSSKNKEKKKKSTSKNNTFSTNIDEGKMLDFVSMFDVPPSETCRKLFCFPDDDSARSNNDNNNQHSNLISNSSFKSFYENGFLILDNFLENDLISKKLSKEISFIFDHAPQMMASTSSSISISENSQQVLGTSAKTSIMPSSQRGDISILIKENKNSFLNEEFPALIQIQQKIKKVGREELSRVLKLKKEQQEEENNSFQLWKYFSSSNSNSNNNNRDQVRRDALPSDGSQKMDLLLQGNDASRKISAFLFVSSNDENVDDNNNNNNNNHWKIKFDNTFTDIEVKNGRLLLFLSGACETQIPKDCHEHCCLANWFF